MIIINDLVKQYSNGLSLITAVDIPHLEFNAGGFYAITGPSGSGKSTLLHCLSGIESPDRGSITVADVTINTLSPSAAAAFRFVRYGIMFQRDHLIEELTSRENLLLLAEYGKVDDATHRIDRLFEQLHISAQADKFPRELSGGERQRVALARALIKEPDIILADEPTANLDSGNGRLMFELLRTLSRNNKLVLVATHDPGIEEFADTVIRLRDGRITDG